MYGYILNRICIESRFSRFDPDVFVFFESPIRRYGSFIAEYAVLGLLDRDGRRSSQLKIGFTVVKNEIKYERKIVFICVI